MAGAMANRPCTLFLRGGRKPGGVRRLRLSTGRVQVPPAAPLAWHRVWPSRCRRASPDFAHLRNSGPPPIICAIGAQVRATFLLASRTVGCVRELDDCGGLHEGFVHFEGGRDVSPVGHASPGDVVFWHGLPPAVSMPLPTQLCFSESLPTCGSAAPKPFLTASLEHPPPRHSPRLQALSRCIVTSSAPDVTDQPRRTFKANLLSARWSGAMARNDPGRAVARRATSARRLDMENISCTGEQ